MSTRINVEVSTELKRDVRKVGIDNDMNLTETVIAALEAYIANNSKKNNTSDRPAIIE